MRRRSDESIGIGMIAAIGIIIEARDEGIAMRVMTIGESGDDTETTAETDMRAGVTAIEAGTKRSGDLETIAKIGTDREGASETTSMMTDVIASVMMKTTDETAADHDLSQASGARSDDTEIGVRPPKTADHHTKMTDVEHDHAQDHHTDLAIQIVHRESLDHSSPSQQTGTATRKPKIVPQSLPPCRRMRIISKTPAIADWRRWKLGMLLISRGRITDGTSAETDLWMA